MIFGGESLPSTIQLQLLGTDAITIFGANANDDSGLWLGGADVNGDGFSDFLIGARDADGLNNEKDDSNT